MHEGDYCFSLPDDKAVAPRRQKETLMKTTRTPVKQSRSGTARRSPGSARSEAASAGESCPREQMIAEAAYYRAERRGFIAGHEMSDWLQAEAEVESLRLRDR